MHHFCITRYVYKAGVQELSKEEFEQFNVS